MKPGAFGYNRHRFVWIALWCLGMASHCLAQYQFTTIDDPNAVNGTQANAISGGTPTPTPTPTPEAGKYTLLLSATDASEAVPQGTGYATLTVSKKGGAVIAGKLADGENFSLSGLIVTGSGGDQLAVNKSLRYSSVTPKGTKGLLSGTLTFVTKTGPCNLYGTLEWTKPPQTEGEYQAAFDTTLDVSGSLYTPPSKGSSVLPGFTAGTLELSDTSGFMLSGTTQLTPANKLAITDPQDGLKVTITNSTGIFKGSFEYPPGKKRKDFTGVLYQDQFNGGGFFLGPAGSGTVSLTPAP